MENGNKAGAHMRVITCIFTSILMATASMARSDQAARKPPARDLARLILADARMGEGSTRRISFASPEAAS